MNRKPNKRILILCEGVTEEIYAKSLKNELPRSQQRAVSVEICRNSSRNDPESLAKEAVKRKKEAKSERNPFDHIWVFFDNDNWPQLSKAFEILDQDEKLSIAYSSICIEHWFILHFSYCGRSFSNGEEALRQLKELWPAYHKTKINHYQILKENLPTAIERALRITKNSDQELPVHQRNPFFTVHRLIKFFIEMKS